MAIRQNFKKKGLWVLLVLVLVGVCMVLFLNTTKGFKDSAVPQPSGRTKMSSKAGPCLLKRDCPMDFLSFSVQSGAANVVAPKICLQNNLVLGVVLNNAGPGINIVLTNGTTGGVVKTGHFDMYSGDVKPLIEFLKSIEKGSLVLMASYDDPSSKLTEEARQLIAELGSSSIKSLGFRDNWVFVGGKAASVNSNFEKFLKNDKEKNKYEHYPELIHIQGCVPRYLE